MGSCSSTAVSLLLLMPLSWSELLLVSCCLVNLWDITSRGSGGKEGLRETIMEVKKTMIFSLPYRSHGIYGYSYIAIISFKGYTLQLLHSASLVVIMGVQLTYTPIQDQQTVKKTVKYQSYSILGYPHFAITSFKGLLPWVYKRHTSRFRTNKLGKA